MKSLYFLVILYLGSLSATADELQPFTTDGCSVFPDGTYKQQSLWLNCCIRHDLAYWKGGSYQQRLEADQALRKCVTEIGEPEIAQLMLTGVRVGGSPYYPTFFRWGYGWPYLRGYRELSENEKAAVIKQLSLFSRMLDSITDEMDKLN